MKQITFFLFLLVLVGCKEEQKPKVKYNTTNTTVEVKKDTSTLQVADLPVQFEGSDILIYPIGDLRVSDLKKAGIDSRSYEETTNFNVSNALENEITGYLRNVKFQKINTDSLYVLTDKNVSIERMTYLGSKKMMVYVVADQDTNQDNIVDTNDIKSLYLSTNMGEKFTKISASFQELIDWNYVEGTSQLFFRTIEDANKNGAFDKKDKLHYFTITLSKDWEAKEFFPVSK